MSMALRVLLSAAKHPLAPCWTNGDRRYFAVAPQDTSALLFHAITQSAALPYSPKWLYIKSASASFYGVEVMPLPVVEVLHI
jgi:hypothetical protein